jgi:hypothetical protein
VVGDQHVLGGAKRVRGHRRRLSDEIRIRHGRARAKNFVAIGLLCLGVIVVSTHLAQRSASIELNFLEPHNLKKP